jgi:hypothetical protein
LERGFGQVGGDGRWKQVVGKVCVKGCFGGREDGGMDNGATGGPMSDAGRSCFGGYMLSISGNSGSGRWLFTSSGNMLKRRERTVSQFHLDGAGFENSCKCMHITKHAHQLYTQRFMPHLGVHGVNFQE